MIYDSYSERHYDEGELRALLKDYFAFCVTRGLRPELHRLEEIDEENIAHVVYHAAIWRDELASRDPLRRAVEALLMTVDGEGWEKVLPTVLQHHLAQLRATLKETDEKTGEESALADEPRRAQR